MTTAYTVDTKPTREQEPKTRTPAYGAVQAQLLLERKHFQISVYKNKGGGKVWTNEVNVYSKGSRKNIFTRLLNVKSVRLFNSL